MEEKKITKKKIFDICFYTIIVAVILSSLFLFSFATVSGDSMYPTLHDGQHLIMTKTVLIGDIERNDIIVVFEKGTGIVIKRVVGLPGEVINVSVDGNIYIDGNKYESEFGGAYREDSSYVNRDITLGDDEYYILGDNRTVSYDSRMFGPVNKSKILGKIINKLD